MTAALIVTLCAIEQPALCETHRVGACPVAVVPMAVATWTRPGWRGARWRCGV